MFSWEICEILKNTYFEDHLQATASSYSKLLIGNIKTTYWEAKEFFSPAKQITRRKVYVKELNDIIDDLQGQRNLILTLLGRIKTRD